MFNPKDPRIGKVILYGKNIWDIPSVTIETFKVIVGKYPSKPMSIIIWDIESAQKE